MELRNVHPSKSMLRSDMGPLDELVSSIEEKGLFEPIVVRPAKDGFEIVAGNRRFQACKKLGMNKIPCHVVELDDREAYETSLVENVQRQTLNPLDEARAFKRYVEECGYGGVSQLARKIGKSQEYVSNRMRLLSLSKRVRDEVIRRRISPGVAQELASLDDGDADEVTEVIRDSISPLTVREARRMVRHHHRAQKQEPTANSDFADRHPDVSERRTRMIAKAVGRAVASLRMDMYRLSEVIDDIDDDAWVVRETLFQCRAALNQQVDHLVRFRRKLVREVGER